MKSVIDLAKSETAGFRVLYNVNNVPGNINNSVPIPAGIKYVHVYVRAVPPALTSGLVGMRVNNDSVSTYRYTYFLAVSTEAFNNSSYVGAMMFETGAASSVAGSVANFEIFGNITPLGLRKFWAQGSFGSTSAYAVTWGRVFQWPDSSTEITSLDFFQYSGTLTSYDLCVIGR
jgi:hypothetical protein